MEMSLDGTKSRKLLQDLDRGSSLKWRITVVSGSEQSPSSCFACRNEECYDRAKKISDHFSNSYTSKKKLHFAYAHRLKRKEV